MCVYSMILDHYEDKWRRLASPWYRKPGEYEYVPPPVPAWPPPPAPAPEEVDEFRRLLERARDYDRRNNQPDCGIEEKKRRLKELADQLGIHITFPE